jgi:hypothetical protein
MIVNEPERRIQLQLAGGHENMKTSITDGNDRRLKSSVDERRSWMKIGG